MESRIVGMNPMLYSLHISKMLGSVGSSLEPHKKTISGSLFGWISIVLGRKYSESVLPMLDETIEQISNNDFILFVDLMRGRDFTKSTILTT
jgi:hypothetical protein